MKYCGTVLHNIVTDIIKIGDLFMSNIIKKIIALFMVCCLLTCAIASCGEDSKAKAYVKDFFAAIAAGNYEKAESLIHPEREIDAKAYFEGIESKSGVDFQKGIKIEKYINIDYDDYSYEYDGESYTITVRTKVSGAVVRFEIVVVNNMYGYGIYKLKTVR